MKTVEQAQRDYDRVVKHNEAQIDAIKRRIEARENVGRDHADLDAELAKVEQIADNAESISRKSLDEAKAHEAITLQKVQQAEAEKADKATAALKGKALAAYKKNGGKAEDFEGDWRTIHKKMLEDATIQGVTEKQTSIIGGM